MGKGAVLAFPDDQGEPLCRLVLERGVGEWAAGWLMCNPSRADHERDDPTVGRVIAHSARAGYPRSLVGNVWGLRTPYPADLWRMLDAGLYTPEMRRANLEALAMIGAQCAVHVAAFGAEPCRRHYRAVSDALDAFTLGGRFPLYCLGETDDRMPLHPLARGKLAIPRDVQLRKWERGGAILLARAAAA